MVSLTWGQVNSWRLKQQLLNPRLESKDLIKVTRQVLGFQAQVLSAAQLALYSRVDNLSRVEIEKAVADQRLIRTWVIRGTLYLVASEDLPLLVAARQAYKNRNWLNYYLNFGLTVNQYERVLETIPKVLGFKPMTRVELASGVADYLKDTSLKKLLLGSGWGSLWKPSSYKGDLSLGPRKGQNATFINPRKVIKDWPEIDPQEAVRILVRRYLNVFGPGTPWSFSRWWEIGLRDAKGLFDSMKDELVEVSVGGWNAVVLQTDLSKITSQEPLHNVRLLPLFDVYTLGLNRGLELEAILHKDYHRSVYRPQGWISAVVLVDGYIQGIWDYQIKGSELLITVQMLKPPTKMVRTRIESEAKRLSDYFKLKMNLKVYIH